jgi:two-component system, sensor histidine kinase
MAYVLLVEDDRTLADTIADLLSSQYRVSVAYDGETALEEASRAAPDSVLLDLGLPEIDGFDVARRLRQLLGDAVRLIAYTARSDVSPRELQAAGFDHVLTKPASIEEISDLLLER